jgi:hypothetical protein
MDARTCSREEVVEKIIGELKPLKTADSPEEVQRFVGSLIDAVSLSEYPPSTGSKRTAQNLKKRFDALIEALADTDDIYIEGRIELDPRRSIIGDPDHYDDHPVYRVNGFGWLYLDRQDLLDILKGVQYSLATYDKPDSRATVLKKECAQAAHVLITVLSEHRPTTYDDGPMRRIAELIYGFHTGDYDADLKRACDSTVKKGRAPIREFGGGPPGDEFEF